MAKIPGIGSEKAVDRAARIKDVLDREKAARPIVGGSDILRQSDTFAERCVRMSAAARDRLL